MLRVAKHSIAFEISVIFCVSLCRWWVGEWQKCSASCGSSGQTKRTVLCIQALSVEEQKALEPSNCEHIPKPESLSSCNTHIPCPADWTTGSWSKVSVGQNLRFRFNQNFLQQASHLGEMNYLPIVEKVF